MTLTEVLAFLATIEKLEKKIEEGWKLISGWIGEIQDENKRKKLLEACKNRDCSVIRKLLFDK